MKFLKACLSFPNLSLQEQSQIQKAIQQIEQGATKSLVKKLNVLQKQNHSIQKPNDLIDNVLETISQYETIHQKERLSNDAGDAQIVISQSYVE